MLELRICAAPGPEASASARSGPITSGLLNMSSMVVTPKSAASCALPGNRCTCESINPGSSVPPLASMIRSPGWAMDASPQAAIAPSRTRTAVAGRTCPALKTRALVMVKVPMPATLKS